MNAETTNFPSTNLERPYHRKAWHNPETFENVNMETTSTTMRRLQRWSSPPFVLHIQPSGTPKTALSSTRSSSSPILSVNPSLCEDFYNVSHVTLKCLLLAQPSFAQLATKRSKIISKSITNHRHTNNHRQYSHGNSRFREREEPHSISSGRSTCFPQVENNPAPVQKS